MGVGVHHRAVDPVGVKGLDGNSIATITNPFPVQETRVSEVDTDNSTTTPLGAGEKYTGEWKAWNGHLGIEVSCFTDVAGGASDDGIRAAVIEVSTDGGVTVDQYIGVDVEATDIVLGGVQFQIGLQGTHYRVTYLNGSTPQTTFRLTTTRLPELPIKGVSIEDTLTDRSLVVVGRNVIVAKDDVSGKYFNVLTTPVSDAIEQPAHNLDVGAYTLGYDEDTNTWNRIRSRQPVDNMTNPGKALNVAGFTLFWNPDGTPTNRWNRGIANVPTDAMSNTQEALLIQARLEVFNGATWDRLRGDIANGLDVDVTRSALPTGAATAAKQDTQITHEAAIRAAVEIMDDWDESDRAKVNPIVGQAGVQAGAGAVDAKTQRVTLASDDPLVARTTGELQNGAETTVDATVGGVQLIAANASRLSLIVQNTGAANMRVGASGVTASTGVRIVPGGHVVFSNPTVTNAVYAIREGSISTTGLAQEVT